MPVALSFALLLLVTLAWLALPFIPALSELLRPRDATPLEQVGRDAGALTHFADGFRRYLGDMALTDTFGETTNGEQPLTQLRDRTPVRVVRSDAAMYALLNAPGTPRTGDSEPQALADLLVVDAPLTLPADMAYEREVYARGDVTGGARSVYRALMADGSATIGADSVVMRWAHADAVLTVSDGTTLTGRATANDELRLGRGVRFQRMLAARIVVGLEERDFTAPFVAESSHTTPWLPDNGTRMASDTLRIAGDVVMPAGAYASGHLVITGSLVIGEGSRIDGSIKTHGSMTVGTRCVVTGTLAARDAVHIGAECRIGGPVIAEREIVIARDSWLGQPTRPTTVTAPRIVLARGVTVFGAVQARDEGWTE